MTKNIHHVIQPKEYFYSAFPIHLKVLLTKIHIGAFPDGGQHFHLSELRPEELSHVPTDELPMFLSTLACTTLYDQLMYSHFRRHYKGKYLTLYPKITSSYSNCTSIVPWELLSVSGASNSELKKAFREFAAFYVPYMKESIERDFPLITWEQVVRIAENDADANQTIYGEVFIHEMKRRTV